MNECIHESVLLNWISDSVGISLDQIEQCQDGIVFIELIRHFYPSVDFPNTPHRAAKGKEQLPIPMRMRNMDLWQAMMRRVDIPFPPFLVDAVSRAVIGDAEANARLVSWLHQHFAATGHRVLDVIRAPDGLPKLLWEEDALDKWNLLNLVANGDGASSSVLPGGFAPAAKQTASTANAASAASATASSAPTPATASSAPTPAPPISGLPRHTMDPAAVVQGDGVVYGAYITALGDVAAEAASFAACLHREAEASEAFTRQFLRSGQPPDVSSGTKQRRMSGGGAGSRVSNVSAHGSLGTRAAPLERGRDSAAQAQQQQRRRSASTDRWGDRGSVGRSAERPTSGGRIPSTTRRRSGSATSNRAAEPPRPPEMLARPRDWESQMAWEGAARPSAQISAPSYAAHGATGSGFERSADRSEVEVVVRGGPTAPLRSALKRTSVVAKPSSPPHRPAGRGEARGYHGGAVDTEMEFYGGPSGQRKASNSRGDAAVKPAAANSLSARASAARASAGDNVTRNRPAPPTAAGPRDTGRVNMSSSSLSARQARPQSAVGFAAAPIAEAKALAGGLYAQQSAPPASVAELRYATGPNAATRSDLATSKATSNALAPPVKSAMSGRGSHRSANEPGRPVGSNFVPHEEEILDYVSVPR